MRAAASGWLSIAILVTIDLSVAAAQKLPGGFVYLRDADPTIVQDIRYAGANNFVGRPLKGYLAAECIVTPAMAAGLARVQRDLAPLKLSLKVLDCYRPQRAVNDMLEWSKDGRETPAQRRYSPKLNKQDLFRLGYIAPRSGHSTGAAVDLTLVQLPLAASVPFDPAVPYADCTGPETARTPENSVDMGTGYDCSDEKAHTASKHITADQRKWRATLVSAMAKHGFLNFRLEWWHFSLPGAGAAAYDFSITPPTR